MQNPCSGQRAIELTDHRTNNKTTIKTMRNKFFSFVFIYGLVLSVIFGIFTIVDNGQLNHAVQVHDLDREMAHRINVVASGTWFMLANILSVFSFGFIKRTEI